jgi:hypothetical protein
MGYSFQTFNLAGNSDRNTNTRHLSNDCITHLRHFKIVFFYEVFETTIPR